ncbi:MAG TPA: alanine racemase [Candidatus Dormibacteraeota bacterium]|nr:alanine racemase [Candidatus Dormibacteraeota bacterium]
MTSLRPAWLEIDLDALAHNVRLHRRAAGPDCRFFAVVKGDGYGVGVVESARTALAAGADALALGNPDEVATLRQAGVSAPILLYASSLPEDAAAIADLGVIPTIHDEASLDALAALGRELDVWVKLDCGVGRLGFLPGAAEAAFRRLAAARHLRLGGVYSHFRNPHDKSQLRSQAAIFLSGCSAATGAGFTGFERMVASSRVVLGAPDLRLTAINPGKALYGYVDASWPHADDIRPVVAALKARVIQVKDHPPGVVLYGEDGPLASPRRTAVVPLGHVDGLNHLPPCGEVLVGGRRAPILSRRGIEHTVIDVTHLPPVAIGDEVVVLGRQGSESISAAEIAATMGVAMPELVARLARMAPRRYLPVRTRAALSVAAE